MLPLHKIVARGRGRNHGRLTTESQNFVECLRVHESIIKEIHRGLEGCVFDLGARGKRFGIGLGVCSLCFSVKSLL